jgi:hypothetical protein
MKQLVPRLISNVGYGGTTYWCATGGENQLSDTFGPDVARAPMPWAATVRDLTVYVGAPLASNLTVTVLKNGVATALTVTVLAGATGPVTASGVDVAYAQFDDISYYTDTAGLAFPGATIGVCIEVESDGNVFGVSPVWGAVDVNGGGIAGALGNGQWLGIDHSLPLPDSGTRSINAVEGALTTLVLKAYSGAVPVGSSWVGALIVNGVEQNGSGGTVDTRCTMTAGNTTAVATFSRPIALTDHVEVIFYRTGALASHAVQVAAGIGFAPTVDGWFMLCGGSTKALTGPPAYTYTYGSSSATEVEAAVPISASGLVARGLYVERSAAPSLGETYTHTIRRTGTSTAIVVTVSDTATTGSIANQFELYAANARLALLYQASAGAVAGSHLHWGLAATVNIPISVELAPGSYAITGFPLNLPIFPAPPEECILEPVAVECLDESTPVAACLEEHVPLRTGSWSGTLLRPSVALLDHVNTDSDGTAGYELNLAPGSYAVAGVAAGAKSAYALALSPGAYALTGVPIAAIYQGLQLLVLDPAAYAITGAALSPIAERVLNLEPGSYAITGVALTPLAARPFTLAPGSYAIDGAPNILVANFISVPVIHELTLDPGSYAVAGAVAEVLELEHHVLALEPGSYDVNGAVLVPVFVPAAPQQHTLLLSPGTYAVSGADAKPQRRPRGKGARAYDLVLSPGTYAVTGVVGVLQYFGAPLNHYDLELGSGAYALTGVALTPRVVRLLNLAAGSYALTGAAIQNRESSFVLIFDASPDHASVTNYTVRLYRYGGPLVASQSLGVPAPDSNNDITVDITSMLETVAWGDYYTTILTTTAGGSSESGPSHVFSVPLV